MSSAGRRPSAPREPAKATVPAGGRRRARQRRGVLVAPRCSTIATAATATSSAIAARRTRRCSSRARVSVLTRGTGSPRRPGCRAPRAARGHRRRRPGQRIRPLATFGNAMTCADVRLARHERHEAVDAHREPAVRRRAHRERVEEEAELLARLLVAHPHRPEHALLHVRAVDPDRAASRAPSRSRRGRSAGSARCPDRSRSAPRGRRRRRERVVQERPAPVSSSQLEEREVDRPRGTAPASRSTSPSSRPRWRRSPPSTRATVARVAAREEHGRARLGAGTPRARARRGTSRSASGPRRPSKTRYASPFAPHSFAISSSCCELRAGELPRRDAGSGPPRRSRRRRTPSRASPRSRPGSRARSGGRACPMPNRNRVRARHPRERPRLALAAERLERSPTTTSLHHPEDVLPVRERELDVELPELELPIGPEILVPEAASRSGSSGRSPPIMSSCLKICGDCGEREEPARLEPRRARGSRARPRASARHARRPDVDETAASISGGSIETSCAQRACSAASASRPQIEPAVAQAQGLVDVLLVELERQRRRAGEDLELVDVQLDLARRHRGDSRSPASAPRPRRSPGARTRSGSPSRARRRPASARG